MEISRKLQKLFGSSGLISAWEHARRWAHPVNSRRILANLNSLDFGHVRSRHQYRPNPRRVRKFIEIIQDLWLDRSPPLQILDLGCGSGYFIYICRLFGHDGIGLDTDVEPLYRETLAVLNVPRVVSRIEAQVPLPDLDRKFDLVAATRVCFHFKGWPQHLPGDEWRDVVMIRHFSHRRCATVFLILVGELFIPRHSLLRTRLRFRGSNKGLRAILRGAVDFKTLRGEPARRFRIEFGMRGWGSVRDDLRAKRALSS